MYVCISRGQGNVRTSMIIISGGRMPPLEQSAIRCHVSSNAHCFSESPQDTPLLNIISCITFNCFTVPISYTVDSSGLAVFT